MCVTYLLLHGETCFVHEARHLTSSDKLVFISSAEILVFGSFNIIRPCILIIVYVKFLQKKKKKKIV